MDEPQLLDHLRKLVDAQLVSAVSAEAFAFRHALTREAVHGTILKRQRQALHALAAQALESVYAEEAQLASHAADWPKTLEYAQRAGEQSWQRYAPQEAAEQFSAAIEAARHRAQPPDQNLLRGRGQAYETLGEFERARADYELAVRRAREGGDAQTEWQVLLDLGFLWGGRDYARGGDCFQRALGQLDGNDHLAAGQA